MYIVPYLHYLSFCNWLQNYVITINGVKCSIIHIFFFQMKYIIHLVVHKAYFKLFLEVNITSSLSPYPISPLTLPLNYGLIKIVLSIFVKVKMSGKMNLKRQIFSHKNFILYKNQNMLNFEHNVTNLLTSIFMNLLKCLYIVNFIRRFDKKCNQCQITV